MNRPRLLLVGASGHGRVALDAARLQGTWEIVGWADSFIETGTEIAGLKVLGKPADLDRLAREHHLDAYFLAISDNPTRHQVREQLRALAPALAWATLVHPSAVVAAGVTLEPGCLLLAGAIVNPDARLGAGCIVNTRASLDHDGEMGEYSSLLPGVVTGGGVSIGPFTCICLGAHLAHRVRIGEHTVVGAGAVVLSDLPAYTLAYGVPARVVRSRTAGERHF